jgi:hypothetical protein
VGYQMLAGDLPFQAQICSRHPDQADHGNAKYIETVDGCPTISRRR